MARSRVLKICKLLLTPDCEKTLETASIAMSTLLKISAYLEDCVAWNEKLFSKYEQLIVSNNLFHLHFKELEKHATKGNNNSVRLTYFSKIALFGNVCAYQLLTHCLLHTWSLI